MSSDPVTGRSKSPKAFLVPGREAAAAATGGGALRPIPGNAVMRRPSRNGGGVGGGGPAFGGRPGAGRPGAAGVLSREDEEQQGGGFEGKDSRKFVGVRRGESGAKAHARTRGVELPTRPAARPIAAKERCVCVSVICFKAEGRVVVWSLMSSLELLVHMDARIYVIQCVINAVFCRRRFSPCHESTKF